MMSKEAQTLRTFLAITIQHELSQQIGETISRLKKALSSCNIHWHVIDKLHITVRFCGNIQFEQVTRLEKSFAQLLQRCAAFDLEIGSPILFPNSDNPRIIALDVHPKPGLLRIAHAAELAAQYCGLPNTDRPYLPHLTLGKIQDDRVPTLDNNPGCLFSKQRVNQLTFFKSDVSPLKMNYTSLYTVSLGCEEKTT